MCEGIAAEKRLRKLGMRAMPILELDEEMRAGRAADRDLHEEDGVRAFDDQSGDALIPGLVRQARREEMEYFKKMRVYEKVTLAECMKATGRKPIAVRWVDINKGDTTNPNYRSRLVAKEFKGNDDRPEWYAAKPPSESLRLMLHRLASRRKFKLLYADVSRAYC